MLAPMEEVIEETPNQEGEEEEEEVDIVEALNIRAPRRVRVLFDYPTDDERLLEIMA